jgi:hypothetical protein
VSREKFKNSKTLYEQRGISNTCSLAKEAFKINQIYPHLGP